MSLRRFYGRILKSGAGLRKLRVYFGQAGHKDDLISPEKEGASLRKSFMVAAVLIFFLFFLPWLWGEEQGGASLPEGGADSPSVPEGDSQLPEVPDAVHDSGTMLRVKIGESVEEMDLETYLQGVVRAEMPASFELEALKAQAIAARTYTLYKMEQGENANHPEADICGDFACCQAYQSEEDAARAWGMSTAVYENKIDRAVAETDGQVILYEGAPVLAVFHSSSAGATQNSGDVWQNSLPYLQSVDSPEGAEAVPNYYSKVSFTLTDFKERFAAQYPTANLSGSPSNWFTNIRQTETGAVLSLEVGGVAVSGTELRTLLGLRSTTFTTSFTDTEVVFSVTGYGHGVGLSQYGANVLAGEGWTCREILEHYYTGASVGVYEG